MLNIVETKPELRADRDATLARGAEAISQYEPPHNIEAEQAVLGAMLIRPQCIGDVMLDLTQEDFYRDQHRTLFSEVCDLWMEADRDDAIDILTLKSRLLRAGKLEAVGGISYLTAILSSVPSASNVGDYAAILKETAHLRRLIDSALYIVGMARGTQSERAGDIQSKAESLILQAGESMSVSAASGAKKREVETFGELSQEVVQYARQRRENPGRLTGASFGFAALDRMLGGMEPGDVTYIGAPPSSGKTAFGVKLVLNATQNEGISAGIISMEMKNRQLVMRALCSVAGIDSLALRAGTLSNDDLDMLDNLSVDAEQRKIYLFADFKPTLSGIRAAIRRLCKRYAVKLVMLDYVGLITADGEEAKGSETGQAQAIARTIKQCARENDCHILALAQITRRPNQSDSKRPTMRDIRYAGDAEADNILLVHRPAQFLPNDQKPPDDKPQGVEIIVGKARSGSVGTVHLRYVPRFTRFFAPETRFDYDPGYRDEDAS